MNHTRRHRRRGAALLLVLFLMAITVPFMAMMLDTHATHLRCTGNHIEATTALYIAEAGVHDAIAELFADSSWRSGFTGKPFADHTYTVTLADGPSGEIAITSTATTSQGYIRTVTVTVAGL